VDPFMATNARDQPALRLARQRGLIAGSGV
jgi:hypothetical protein